MTDDTSPERPAHEPGLENLLTEDRRFPPSPEFAAQANAQHDLYAWANADRPSFWADQARELLELGEAVRGGPRLVERAVRALVRRRDAERGVQRGRPARRGGQRRPRRPALRGRGRRHPHDHLRGPAARGLQGRERVHARSASAPGDRVAIYLPLIPEAVVTMLACARIGAPHSVVFGGFSAEALSTRINDAEAKLVVTADGGYRRGARQRAEARGRRGDRPRARRRSSTSSSSKRTGQDVDLERRRRRLVVRRRRHAPATSTRRSRSRPSTRCSSSTRRAPPGSRRASSTPPAAT